MLISNCPGEYSIKYVHGVLNSDNSVVKLCGQLTLNGSRSDVADSINFICDKYDICKHNLVNSKCITKCVSVPRQHNIQTGISIKEFINMRDDILMPTHDIHNLNDIISDLCINCHLLYIQLHVALYIFICVFFLFFFFLFVRFVLIQSQPNSNNCYCTWVCNLCK